MATHKQDDYLVCKEYQEQIHQKSPDHPGFITFKHQNGNHYFAWVNGDQIVLRSEAYPDKDKMERGIKAILKNCDLVERYSLESEHGAHFLVLWGGGDHQKHTGNRQQHSEISRSCPQKSKEALHALLVFKGKNFADKVVPNISSGASTDTGATASTATHNTPVAAPNSQNAGASNDNSSHAALGGMGWLKWLLPLLLIAGALLWWKNCKTSTDANTETSTIEVPAIPPAEANADTSMSATTSANVSTPAVESIKVKLIDGVELKANKGGVEDKLVAFLGDANAKFDPADKKGNWYDFDNLNFDLGKSTITPASMVQIDNLVAILKAYPALKIKVGGYTDRKGDDAANMKLSQSRADAVIAALKSKGASASQLTSAEGYGETLATIDENASDEERRVDRRTSVRVMAR
jgi:outer membrane protein OmpA-like peptidoglycan-associated protein/uncharacterized protein YegP (UPF0339 family)